MMINVVDFSEYLGFCGNCGLVWLEAAVNAACWALLPGLLRNVIF